MTESETKAEILSNKTCTCSYSLLIISRLSCSLKHLWIISSIRASEEWISLITTTPNIWKRRYKNTVFSCEKWVWLLRQASAHVADKTNLKETMGINLASFLREWSEPEFLNIAWLSFQSMWGDYRCLSRQKQNRVALKEPFVSV